MDTTTQHITLSEGWEAIIYREWEFPNEVIESWNSLVKYYGDIGIFISYGWFENWWKAFGKKGELFIVVLMKDKETKAIFPCSIKNNGHGDYIASLTNDHTCHYDFVIEPAVRQLSLSRFVQVLQKTYPNARSYFEYMETQGDNFISLTNELRSKRISAHKGSDPWSPWLRVSGDWMEFYNQLPGRLKNTLKRCRKKAEGQGKLRFEIIQQSEQLDRALNDLFEVEYKSWKGRDGTAIKCHKDVETFYRRFAHWSMQHNHLLLFMLKLDDTLIAADYCLYYGQTVFLLKPGYNESFGHIAPGNLLHSEVFKYLFESSQFTIYNFLGACEPWKMEWTSKTGNYGQIKVYPKTIKGRSLYAFECGWKDLLKEIPAARRFKSWLNRCKNN